MLDIQVCGGTSGGLKGELGKAVVVVWCGEGVAVCWQLLLPWKGKV